MMIGAIGFQGLRLAIKEVEIGILLGVIATYAMLLSRLGVPERTHLFEYSILAALIYQILAERRANGLPVNFPGFRAVVAGSMIGLVDETIQLFFPGRYFDFIDVGFNALACFMAVAAILVLSWGRTKFIRSKKSE